MKAAAKRATTKEKKKQKALRLDAITKAQIVLYAKARGESSNSFIMSAVRDRIRRAESESGVQWSTYSRFPTVPGYLECLMYLEKNGPFRWNDEEAQRATFVLHHRQFFYHGKKPHTVYLQQLWPNLDEYVALWGHGKQASAAAEAMSATLKALGLPVPPWSPLSVYDEDNNQGTTENH